MVRLTIEIDTFEDAQAVKESAAMELERFGDCHIIEVKEFKPQQQNMEGYTDLDSHKNRINRAVSERILMQRAKAEETPTLKQGRR